MVTLEWSERRLDDGGFQYELDLPNDLGRGYVKLKRYPDERAVIAHWGMGPSCRTIYSSTYEFEDVEQAKRYVVRSLYKVLEGEKAKIDMTTEALAALMYKGRRP